jgi:hypothetical protein
MAKCLPVEQDEVHTSLLRRRINSLLDCRYLPVGPALRDLLFQGKYDREFMTTNRRKPFGSSTFVLLFHRVNALPVHFLEIIGRY